MTTTLLITKLSTRRPILMLRAESKSMGSILGQVSILYTDTQDGKGGNLPKLRTICVLSVFCLCLDVSTQSVVVCPALVSHVRVT
ncbi:hypothetical protein BaRGS_00029323 [Batillaria attramentaria]|uniref:Uncharacterized protein n=1 Tax=Batillaria attramentaria TaxID=370345 RepID=A0ABD0JWI4_9CAEN